MNKKVVFLVVLLECILAIFIVSIFGHAIEDSRRQILCQDIYFVDANGEKIEDGEMIEYSLVGSDINYQLYWVMETDKTSNKEVIFESSNTLVKVNSEGLVMFIEEVPVVITIRATDGSGKSDSVTLVPKSGDIVVD